MSVSKEDGAAHIRPATWQWVPYEEVLETPVSSILRHDELYLLTVSQNKPFLH